MCGYVIEVCELLCIDVWVIEYFELQFGVVGVGDFIYQYVIQVYLLDYFCGYFCFFGEGCQVLLLYFFQIEGKEVIDDERQFVEFGYGF